MTKSTHTGAFLVLGLISAFSAHATEGVVLINQNRALAGSITPGDAPGFPVTISRPGSYRLSGNLFIPQDTNGIVIEADHVTLDLNGFTISGANPARPSEGANAIFAGGSRDTTLLNGAVTGMDRGIFLNDATEARIESIRATANRSVGILLAGYGAISNCTASRNGIGIELVGLIDRVPIAEASTLRWNDTNGNSGPGMVASCPNTNLIGNTALGNGHPDVRFDGDRCQVTADNFFGIGTLE